MDEAMRITPSDVRLHELTHPGVEPPRRPQGGVVPLDEEMRVAFIPTYPIGYNRALS